MKVLFVGSGPYRVSQETRGNIFANSCLEYFKQRGIPFAVMDNDAAGPLFSATGPEGYLSCPFDAGAVADVMATEEPTHVWPVCAGKEVQALFVRHAESTGAASILPGGTAAYRAAADWSKFREIAEAAGVAVPFGGVATSIEEAAAVAGRVGFPVFLSASEPRGGGGARIVYNYEDLASHAGRLLTWSLSGRVLVVRVHEKHPQCEVHVLADSGGRHKVLGVVDAMAPLGIHIANAATVFPAQGISAACRKAAGRAACALAEGTGLVGYGVFHFGVEGESGAYTVGMRAGFTSSSYIVAMGLGLDLGRAATAAAFGRSIRDAGRIAGDGGRVAVSVPHFDNRLFPGSSDILGPHKMSTGMGTGVAKAFPAAFLAAERAAREDPNVPGLEEAFAAARAREVLPAVAAPRTTFLTDVAAAIARGSRRSGLEEVGAASGIGRKYMEELAALVRVYQALLQANKSRSQAAKAIGAARRAGFTDSEIARAIGTEGEKKQRRRTKPKRASRRKAFVLVGPPACAVGCVDESDVVLGGMVKAFASKGHKIVLAGWRSRQPLDVYFMADDVLWGEARETLTTALFSPGGVAAVYVDPRNSDWEDLSRQARAAGATLVSADPDIVSTFRDRKALANHLARAGLLQKEGEEATGAENIRRAAARFGYPVLAREKGVASRSESGFVVAHDQGQLEAFLREASGTVVVERFLEDLVEAAVVVLCDGKEARAAAVIEVLEEPGISSIDRAEVLPPFSIGERSRDMLASRAEALAKAVGARGLVTVRLGMRYDVAYYLSATAGASREIPFASAALRRDIVGAAGEIFAGAPLARAWPDRGPYGGPVFIRQPVFSFGRFPGADTVLGTTPRSTGDVMGAGTNFALAYAAARRGTGRSLPSGGTVFVSLRDRDKRAGMLIGRQLTELGFKVVATEGTALALASAGVEARAVYRVSEGRPNVVDLLKNREITMVIYTPSGRAPREDEVQIRTVAWGLGIPVITSAGEALAALGAIEAIRKH